MINAYGAIKEDDGTLAYKKLSDAERYREPSQELKAEIVYLRGICLEKEEKYDEALGQYTYLIENHPESEYSYRVKSKLLILKKYQDQNLSNQNNKTNI